ncbi:unknown similar to AMEV245 [Choristoneura rosaceana entomopoxvirus 'L']|uniref:Uncharacterized protein n=1 Tax=Choristoneura rosaceana entomopoxvirus 'L' TaxID=1293539 RepID=A0ABM9QKT5_9POXV|nr:unknown similar to AMEV245 [Choristoneura rosaceana entomopoxvirus 'L']CCU56149.1 unknown similar to AMEV245 [Choristoneura rosaceana entomopoxvirus 'L']
MEIIEYTNMIYNKLIERIEELIINIKNEMVDYIDKTFFNIRENIEELVNNKCNKLDKILAKTNKINIINYPDYIIGNNISNISSNIIIYVPKKIDTRYKINNVVYIPYLEITHLSKIIDIYNEYSDEKIKNIYLKNIENIIILSDPLLYISVLKSYLSIDKYTELTYDINNLTL